MQKGKTNIAVHCGLLPAVVTEPICWESLQNAPMQPPELIWPLTSCLYLSSSAIALGIKMKFNPLSTVHKAFYYLTPTFPHCSQTPDSLSYTLCSHHTNYRQGLEQTTVLQTLVYTFSLCLKHPSPNPSRHLRSKSILSTTSCQNLPWICHLPFLYVCTADTFALYCNCLLIYYLLDEQLPGGKHHVLFVIWAGTIMPGT